MLQWIKGDSARHRATRRERPRTAGGVRKVSEMSALDMSPPELELHGIVMKLLDQLELIRDQTQTLADAVELAHAAMAAADLDLEAWHLKWAEA